MNFKTDAGGGGIEHPFKVSYRTDPNNSQLYQYYVEPNSYLQDGTNIFNSLITINNLGTWLDIEIGETIFLKGVIDQTEIQSVNLETALGPFQFGPIVFSEINGTDTQTELYYPLAAFKENELNILGINQFQFQNLRQIYVIIDGKYSTYLESTAAGI